MKKNIPALRFPQFADAPKWEIKSFFDCFITVPSKKYQIKATDFCTSGKYKVIDQGQNFIAGYSDLEKFVFKNYPIIIFGDHTTILKFIDFEFIVGADGTKLLKNKNDNFNLRFLYHFLELNNIAQQGYKRHFTMLSEISLNIPSLAEQTQIANFFAAVDNRIFLLKQKYEQLKLYKKGIMQQIFSQKLRFKDENDEYFPDWEIKMLGEVGEIVGGGTPDTKKIEFWNGNETIQWFTPTEIKSNFVFKSKRTISKEGLKNSSAKLLPVGTVLFTSRATIGDVAITTEECATNQGFQSFVVNKNNNNLFLSNWLRFYKDNWLKLASGSTFLEISKTTLSKLPILCPSLAEQEKIGEFLSLIDAQIENVGQQVEKTQLWKRGLLQKMMI